MNTARLPVIVDPSSPNWSSSVSSKKSHVIVALLLGEYENVMKKYKTWESLINMNKPHGCIKPHYMIGFPTGAKQKLCATHGAYELKAEMGLSTVMRVPETG